ncbi:hypothetical protein [Denitromonas sp.]|uniref:hypothetical protein n=1 Tax=Denitromonas sp. TaxID=2734609 RepID=UPI003A84D85F
MDVQKPLRLDEFRLLMANKALDAVSVYEFGVKDGGRPRYVLGARGRDQVFYWLVAEKSGQQREFANLDTVARILKGIGVSHFMVAFERGGGR